MSSSVLRVGVFRGSQAKPAPVAAHRSSEALQSLQHGRTAVAYLERNHSKVIDL